MKKVYLSILLVFAVMALGVIAYASVAVSKNGTQIGAAEIINILNTSGINWNFDGFSLTINGVNWQSITGANLSQVNWTGANINAPTGVNWESLRVSYGNTSTSINWQAFGV